MGKGPDTKIVSNCRGCPWYELGQKVNLKEENDKLQIRINELERQLAYANRCEKNKREELYQLRRKVKL